jgi:glycosyltransferase involved in cell wall biosynthesis
LKESKHILILTSWYPNEREPYLGNFVEQFAKALSKRHKVILLYNDFSSPTKYGVEQEKVNDTFSVCRAHIPSKKGVFYKYVAHKMGMDYLEKNFPKFDLIHCQIGIRDWCHFLATKKRFNLPLVYTEHGSYFIDKQYSKLPFLKRYGLKKLLKNTSENTGVSQELADSITNISNKKVRVIPNFLPNEWFEFPVNEAPGYTYKFLHISTLDKNKNLQGILDACKLVKEKGITNWELTIVSEEDFAEFKNWTIANDLQLQVIFQEHVPHAEMPELYAKHDCFVLNSFRETFSIVNAEALCFGLHLISTPVGFLNKDNASFIDKVNLDNPLDLSIKMEDAILKKKTSGKNGREFVEKFQENRVMNQYQEIYDDVLR